MLTATESFKKLEQLVVQKDISFYKLSQELKWSSSFFSEWKRGKMMPKVDKLKTLADYFEVPIEYFID